MLLSWGGRLPSWHWQLAAPSAARGAERCACHGLSACLQVRVPLAELPALVRRLTDMELSWQEVAAKYPAQAQAGDE